ncbi:glycosyltransferase family 2 protein, partial [Escherichia marmotae]|nr:glycosyltransferase family 2 protein [Escherichia marmotae]
YNGEKYISEQIKSILNMSGFDIYVNSIIVCDDNSTDRTLEIIKAIVPREKLCILKNATDRNLGPVKNFERGILASKSEYVMLSDQDDVWNNEKLLACMDARKKCNEEKSFLIFSDLEVVDRDLNLIAESFQEYQSIPYDWHKNINNLLIQNVAPGCTMFFNKKLISMALPLPDECIMHDWWLLLVATLHGEVYFLKDKLIKYRQHGNNQVGAKKNGLIEIAKDFYKLKQKAEKNLKETILQMNAFSEKFDENLPQNTKDKIKAWNKCFFGSDNLFVIFSLMRKYDLRKSTLIKTVGLYYLMLQHQGSK